VVLYLSKKRANPRIIYLMARARPAQKVTELVEWDMPVGDVMALLDSRGLSNTFAQGASIFCKRQDGSTIPLRVDPMTAMKALEEKIASQEVRKGGGGRLESSNPATSTQGWLCL
jgi:hypothetical protein